MHYCTLIAVADFPRLESPPDWVVIDCRFHLSDKSRGMASYREGHIPGAYYADLERDLSGQVTFETGRHPLPDWQDFTDCLGRWGIHQGTQVIVYDQDDGSYASRLWWMLRAVGHEQVAVLEGGWAAWLAAGGPVNKGVEPLKSHSFEMRPGSGWVTTGQLQQCLDSDKCLLVDARSMVRYTGEYEPIDPVAGHVPGAVNRPFTDNLQADGSFLPVAELRRQWSEILKGCSPGAVVHMCGSGVTACHNLLAMEVAYLTGSKLYVGSWSEWIRGDDRPVARGGG